MASLPVPLDLRIRDGEVRRGAGERAVVRAADQTQAPAVDTDLLVDHLDVVVRTDRTGAVRWSDRQLVQAGAVRVVEDAGEWRVRSRDRPAVATGGDGCRVKLGRSQSTLVEGAERLRRDRAIARGRTWTE